MRQNAVFRLDFGDWHFPDFRRGGLQPLARARSCLLIQHAPEPHRAARLRMQMIIEIVFADVPVGLGIDALHLRPVSAQLFANHHRIGGQDPLPQIRLIDADQHAVIGRDHNPWTDLDPCFGRRQPRHAIDARELRRLGSFCRRHQ